MSGSGRRAPRPLRSDVWQHARQAAGHRGTRDGRYTGLLQCADGTVLKPILKESQKQEVAFYERLQTTEDPDLVEFRQFVPRYYGTTKFTYNGYEQEYIVLEDLAKGMLQTCVMDIKIGKRTWDQFASPEKVSRERGKYSLCKQQFSFCIPGFVVVSRAGRVTAAGKQHGKSLHGDLVLEALRQFLNASSGAISRALLLELLSPLWRLQRWSGARRTLRLAAASLLLLYDAHALPDTDSNECRPIPRSRTFPSFPSPVSTSSVSFAHTQHSIHPSHSPINSPWTEALKNLKNHSFEHNYEDKVHKMKVDYQNELEQLSSDTPAVKCPTGTVRVIDFAHAHFHDDEEPSVDENFKEGIDSLVNIFEMLLKETDDQV